MIDSDAEKRAGNVRLPVLRAALTILLVTCLVYVLNSRYDLTWPTLVWVLPFAILPCSISYLKGIPTDSKVPDDPPGVFTLRTIFQVLVIIYILLLPDATTLLDAVVSQTWPIFVGIGIGWVYKSMLDLIREFRLHR